MLSKRLNINSNTDMSQGFKYFILFVTLYTGVSFTCVQANHTLLTSNRFFQSTENSFERDSTLILNIEKVENKNILRVSFNSNKEGNEGNFKIFDEKGKLRIQSNFELIPSPYYASVDISSLSAGNYKVTLETEVRTINSTLTVK